MTSKLCAGTNTKGTKCKFPAWKGTNYCAPCLARSGDARGKQEMRDRNAASLVKQAENAELARRRVCDLMTAAGQVKELEAAVLEAANNRGPALERVKLIQQCVATAAAITKTSAPAEEKPRVDMSKLTDEELAACRTLSNAKKRLLLNGSEEVEEPKQ